MKKLKTINIQKQWSIFGKPDTMRDVFLHWTYEISLFRTYQRLLKFFIPMFYKYSFWILKLVKFKTSLFLFRQYLNIFPAFYKFFPFHKVVQQSHLKDVDFYSFFLKNPIYKGFFIPNFLFINTKNLIYKKNLLDLKKSLFIGLNYLVYKKNWTFFDSLKINTKGFDTKLNWTKTDLSLKTTITLPVNLQYLDIYNIYNLNSLFLIYLYILKNIYIFFVLVVFYKV